MAFDTPALLQARHIQDHNQANTTQRHYFGYPSRVLPCTKDAGTCAYLDAVYWMQELHILYSWILWAVLLSILVGWWIVRRLRVGRRAGVHARGSLLDLWGERWEGAWRRRWGVKDFEVGGVFRGVSRLQVAVLGMLGAYLLVFSLVGVVYRVWITPVKGTSLHNTRTAWVAGISDRVGVLAFALTPLTILLSMRESVLSQVTGIPYQHFTFLHRWTGRIIFAQSFLHTLGWTVVEGRLYQPQPSVYREFMAQQYIVFGVVAMFLLTLMWVLSTEAAVRRTGYGVFKVVHWALAVLYLGACWGHWDKLWCWIVPSLGLVVVDQVVQWGRTAYIHFRPGGASKFGFESAAARILLFSSADEGAVVRLDFEHPLSVSQLWQAGQHFMLCFPALSIWQSHPITIASLPEPGRQQRHTYLIRVRSGQTAKLAALGHGTTTPVIMTGPYGTAFPSLGVRNVLAVAGGTGVTFTLPIVLQALREERWRRLQSEGDEKAGLVVSGIVEFVWVVKKGECLLWLEEEMKALKSAVDEYGGLRVKILVTREGSRRLQSLSGSSADATDGPGKQETDVCTVSLRRGSSGLGDLVSTENSRWSVTFLDGRHPSMHEVVSDFVCRADELGGGVAEVLGSGPEVMGSDLRAAVADVKGRLGLWCYWDSR